MKTLQYASLLFLGFLLYSCFSFGSATLPSASEGYVPQKTYTQSSDELFNIVQNVLLNERINIASLDKDSKRIQTDYIQGSSQLQLLSVLTTRYKFTIILGTQGTTSTSLNIIATLESSSKNIEWHDISKDNVTQITNLENWLYEKIQKTIEQGGV